MEVIQWILTFHFKKYRSKLCACFSDYVEIFLVQFSTSDAGIYSLNIFFLLSFPAPDSLPFVC